MWNFASNIEDPGEKFHEAYQCIQKDEVDMGLRLFEEARLLDPNEEMLIGALDRMSQLLSQAQHHQESQKIDDELLRWVQETETEGGGDQKLIEDVVLGLEARGDVQKLSTQEASQSTNAKTNDNFQAFPISSATFPLATTEKTWPKNAPKSSLNRSSSTTARKDRHLKTNTPTRLSVRSKSVEPSFKHEKVSQSANFPHINERNGKTERSPDAQAADEWFDRLLNETKPFIDGENDMFLNRKIDGKRYRPVRIAVLDTGFASRTPEDRSMTASFRQNVKKYRNFVKGSDKDENWTDDSGHGTAVAYQLTRVCPNAHIYIARVCEKSDNGSSWVPVHDAVVEAIKVAIDTSKDGWNVDIINMSFGWEKSDDRVREALKAAHAKDVLMFASTTNSGATTANKVLFPASSSYVTSVDAASGHGVSASFAAKTRSVDRFAAPGLQVKGPDGRGLNRLDGSSYASSILAGTAALVLEFSRQYPLGQDSTVEQYLKRQENMEFIMHNLMSEVETYEGAHFIEPYLLLGNSGNRYGGNGEPRSPRFSVGESIVRKLRLRNPDHIGRGKGLEIS